MFYQATNITHKKKVILQFPSLTIGWENSNTWIILKVFMYLKNIALRLWIHIQCNIMSLNGQKILYHVCYRIRKRIALHLV